MSKPCQPLVDSQMQQGSFVNHEDAKQLLRNYLNNSEELQMGIKEEDLVYGFVYGLDVLRNFIKLIDDHNKKAATGEDGVTKADEINAIRIYRAKRKLNGTASAFINDLVMVPVRTNGVDFPQSLNNSLGDNMILCNAGPCPNVCENLYFHTDDFKG